MLLQPFTPLLTRKNNHATEEDDDSISPPSDVDFIPDPIDPFDLILSNEVETEIISEDEIEALSPNDLSDNMYDVNISPYIQEGTTEDEAADNKIKIEEAVTEDEFINQNEAVMEDDQTN